MDGLLQISTPIIAQKGVHLLDVMEKIALKLSLKEFTQQKKLMYYLLIQPNYVVH